MPSYQTANVYSFTVQLTSRIKTNHHRGDFTLVAAQNPTAAVGIVQGYYGSDLQSFQGPVLANANVLTTMTGSLAHEEEPAAEPPATKPASPPSSPKKH